MSTRTCTLLSVLALIAPLALPGCKSSSEEAEAALGQLDTPLPHDPTDKFEIGPWWSDGKHLLNLRADGGYTIYSNNNRYSRALDRGRWGQQNYATMWLMPYGGNEPQRIRVAITRIDGRIALLPPRYGTMFAVAAPPTTMEDRLIGEWSGPMGGLMLNADSTYAFSPTIGAVDGEGRILAGHHGRWSLAGDAITLTPTTPSVSNIALKMLTPQPTAPGDGAQPAAPTAPAEPLLDGLGGVLSKAKSEGA
ncbi:MAG TPA: hypothetical protein VMS30_05000 [Phycisphaerales bacterium]|nr:hypothetical protein [Phycisphaerales bacterium]